MLQVTWKYLTRLHCKFPCESDSERILKIGSNLPKLFYFLTVAQQQFIVNDSKIGDIFESSNSTRQHISREMEITVHKILLLET